MQIVLNGNPAETAAPTVRALLDEQGIDAEARGVAVAVNETVVPRRRLGRDGPWRRRHR